MALLASFGLGRDDIAMALPSEDILRLPVEERLELVDAIWESIRAEADQVPLTDAMRQELDRRLAAHDADPDAAEDADVVLRRLRRR